MCNPSGTVKIATPQNFLSMFGLAKTPTTNLASHKAFLVAKPYQKEAKQCQLFFAEKYFILTADPNTTLNKQTERINKSAATKTDINKKTANLKHEIMFYWF